MMHESFLNFVDVANLLVSLYKTASEDDEVVSESYRDDDGDLVLLGETDSFDIDNPPLDDPDEFFRFLKWFHSPSRMEVEERLYQEKGRRRNQGINPMVFSKPYAMGEIALAIKIAIEKGIDPRKISPVFLDVAAGFHRDPESYREVVSKQEEHEKKKLETRTKLMEQKDLLWDVLAKGNVVVHSTNMESLSKILKNGLICGSVHGGTKNRSIQHTTLMLKPSMPGQTRDEVFEQNVEVLSEPHKNNLCTVVFSLPPMTAEQKMEMRDEGRDVLSFFLERSGDDFTLPARYIEGYIDQETGIFHDVM